MVVMQPWDFAVQLRLSPRSRSSLSFDVALFVQLRLVLEHHGASCHALCGV